MRKPSPLFLITMGIALLAGVIFLTYTSYVDTRERRLALIRHQEELRRAQLENPQLMELQRKKQLEQDLAAFRKQMGTDRNAYIRRVEKELKGIATEPGISHRVEDIKSDHSWTDRRFVGIAGDGYVFCFELHNCRGFDAIPTTNILYLPDDQQFLVSGKHSPLEFGGNQPRNKAEVKTMFGK